MLVFEGLAATCRGIYLKGKVSHLCYLLKDFGVVCSLGRCSAPAEWAVITHQSSGSKNRIQPLKTAYYDLAGFFFIFTVYLLFSQSRRAGYRTPESIGVSGAQARDVAPGLSPGRGIRRMGVDYTAYLREGLR